jgi:hypothetical protein
MVVKITRKHIQSRESEEIKAFQCHDLLANLTWLFCGLLKLDAILIKATVPYFLIYL